MINAATNSVTRSKLVSIALIVLVLLMSVLVFIKFSALRGLWQRKDMLLLHTLEQTVLALEPENPTANELTNSIRWLRSYIDVIYHYNAEWLEEALPYSDELSSLTIRASLGTVDKDELLPLRDHLEGLMSRLRSFSPGSGPFRREVKRTILGYVEQR